MIIQWQVKLRSHHSLCSFGVLYVFLTASLSSHFPALSASETATAPGISHSEQSLKHSTSPVQNPIVVWHRIHGVHTTTTCLVPDMSFPFKILQHYRTIIRSCTVSLFCSPLSQRSGSQTLEWPKPFRYRLVLQIQITMHQSTLC